MRRRNTLLATLGLAAAAGLVAVATAMPVSPAAPLSAAVAKIGEKAPAFKLMDLNGKAHSLADFKGKTVVFEFFSSMWGLS
ncbi:MAG: redoxin domain-containing protein, partial [Phycisphaerales bacterium]